LFTVTLLKRSTVVLALAMALPYAWAPVYRFPDPVVFTGPHLFNPYQDLGDVWQRANLHAHGRAWGGLTNGQQPADEVVRRYTELGYSVAGISDYERIASHHGVPTIPIYEHGYNVGKAHQLAIGARRVVWLDFLLWQSMSQQQYVIDRLAASADLVALAHPSMRDAYSFDDLQQLTGYQLIEVVNGPFAIDDVWDAALSAGRVVWGLANDDTHDVNDPRRTAAAWTMINAPTASTRDVVDALRAGRSYAVSRVGDSIEPIDTVPVSVALRDGRLEVHCSGAPSTFVFVGQDGAIRQSVADVTSAAYAFEPSDTYIRTVIRSPRTTIYLNPVLRYDGSRIPTPAATIDRTGTWLVRLSSALGVVLAAVVWRRRRGPALAGAARPVLPGADRKPA
jgi:hypothetical protein